MVVAFDLIDGELHSAFVAQTSLTVCVHAVRRRPSDGRMPTRESTARGGEPSANVLNRAVRRRAALLLPTQRFCTAQTSPRAGARWAMAWVGLVGRWPFLQPAEGNGLRPNIA